MPDDVGSHHRYGRSTVENWASTLLPIAILVLAFWFLVLRPARAQRRDFQGLQSQLAPGQRVMLASGIFGETVTIGDETVELLVAPGTVITVNRHAVSRIIADEIETEPESSTDS
ncbi:preprotein translocase subunit YajC [Aeromicrobium yanjiei]|uniref:Preprotein translocase subunit YajC n=1 Tax=Aeromicrobium yanjiei TaxID=2662028 RepID=A0A5Q2MF07_9ACTN|nr:preprotein translocase subunit YajC [Aeromicrobium yanjiei]